MDVFGRTIDYLRLSITDRCDERCVYCRPARYPGAGLAAERLSAVELARVVRVAAACGFRKFRLTGGEPLLRSDLVALVEAMAETPGVECLGLSTNGTRLEWLARPLRAAGLRTVNISLDTLRPEIYRQVTGGALAKVLAGIAAAHATGFERVKLNTVLMRGVNEADLWPLTQFAAARDLPIRFIELMPLTTREVLNERHFLSVKEAFTLLSRHDTLTPAPESRLGHGPARYYRLRRTGAIVGFIDALTRHDFCAQCNKLRLTADGKLRPCLGQAGELDLRAALAEETDEALRARFAEAAQGKPPAHDFPRGYQPCRPMTAIGG